MTCLVKKTEPSEREWGILRQEAKPWYVGIAILLVFTGGCALLLLWLVLGDAWSESWADRVFPFPVIGLAIGLHICMSSLLDKEAGHRRLAAIENLKEGAIDEIQVRASAVVEIPYVGDNEHIFCFQVGVDHLLYMGGPYLDDDRIYIWRDEEPNGDEVSGDGIKAEKAFPNDHFIIRRLPRDGRVLSIELLGRALESGGKAKVMKRGYDFPESYLFEGVLDFLSASLKQADKTLRRTRKDRAAEFKRQAQMKKTATSWLLNLGSFAGLALILAITVYAVQNKSGHTGMNPYRGLALFIPIALAGVICLLASWRSPGAKWPAVVALLTGMLGVGLLVYLDITNTLLEYGVWIDRGMP
jgi:hypothetical protein